MNGKLDAGYSAKRGVDRGIEVTMRKDNSQPLLRRNNNSVFWSRGLHSAGAITFEVRISFLQVFFYLYVVLPPFLIFGQWVLMEMVCFGIVHSFLIEIYSMELDL